MYLIDLCIVDFSSCRDTPFLTAEEAILVAW